MAQQRLFSVIVGREPIADVEGKTATLPRIAPFVRLHDWLSSLRAWWASPAAYPVYIFGLTRLLLLGITFGGLALLQSPYRLAPIDPGQFWLNWQHWDVIWYQRIATVGYADVKSSAFFPLMPLLMHAAGAPFTGWLGNLAYFYAGMALANAAFLGALVVFYRYVTAEYGQRTAQTATLLLAIYPKAFFTFTAYTEGLFLLCFIASYVLLRRGHFAGAGIAAALATLCRSAGVVLGVAFAIELYQRNRWDIRRWLRDGWPLLLIPLALGGYMAYLGVTVHDPLGAFHAQVYWGHALTFPLLTLVLGIVALGLLPFGSILQYSMGLDLLLTLLWIWLLIGASLPRWRQTYRIPPSAIGFTLVYILLLLSSPIRLSAPHLLDSMSRYLLPAFPVFIILARALEDHPRMRQGVLAVSGTLFVLFALGFVLGSWII